MHFSTHIHSLKNKRVVDDIIDDTILRHCFSCDLHAMPACVQQQ